MSFDYLPRLVWLCLASFFLVQLGLGMAAVRLAPLLIRRLEPGPARTGARVLLALRLFPVACATVVSAGIAVPAYLAFEANHGDERVGLLCLVPAFLGAAVWMVAMVRGLRAGGISRRSVRFFRDVGRTVQLGEENTSGLVVREGKPCFALAGILQPRLIVSNNVLRALSREQLRVALRHECAHRASRDNLKRLVLLLAPEVIPFGRRYGVLERAWARFSELAADDEASNGSAEHALALASALVCVARLGAHRAPSPLASSLVADQSDLEGRVSRLLTAGPRSHRRSKPWFMAAGATLLVLAAIRAGAHPAVQSAVHEMLEFLVRS